MSQKQKNAGGIASLQNHMNNITNNESKKVTVDDTEKNPTP